MVTVVVLSLPVIVEKAVGTEMEVNVAVDVVVTVVEVANVRSGMSRLAKVAFGQLLVTVTSKIVFVKRYLGMVV